MAARGPEEPIPIVDDPNNPLLEVSKFGKRVIDNFTEQKTDFDLPSTEQDEPPSFASREKPIIARFGPAPIPVRDQVQEWERTTPREVAARAQVALASVVKAGSPFH